MKSKSKYVLFVKPIADVSVAVLLLVAVSPVMLLVAGILSFYAEPVLFRHRRPGYEGKPFFLIKFRSLSSSNSRRFAFGQFLRKTSLDELPQLINIIKGEMSFVGPRPLLEAYLDLYSEEEHQRHWVKPGVTGWAQVNGRNVLKLEEKVKMDIWYVHHVSLKTDLRILLKTFVQVFKWKESDYHTINHSTL